MANANNVPLTRSDLTAAAWRRFEAARDAHRARLEMRRKLKPFEESRDAYIAARGKVETAAREFELMEQRMLLQDSADAEGVAA